MTSDYGILTLYNENDIKKNLKLINKGDIVLFHRQSLKENKPTKTNKYPGHCGIYIGNNNFIHCSRPKKKVIISNLNNEIYWKQVLVASKDIISDNKIKKKNN